MPAGSSINLKTIITILKGRIPGQVIIQITDKCNALCAQCGMRATNKFERKTIALDHVKKMLDNMPSQGIQAVSFTGGEPFLHVNELCELISYAGRLNIPYIRTGTNGFIFRGHEQSDFEKRIHILAKRLAQTPLRNFWISLDSAVPQLHEKNRGLAGVVKGIEKSLPIFHEYGLYPSANLGINRLTGGEIAALQPSSPEKFDAEKFYLAFCRAFADFYSFVSNLGFTIVNACYPMSVGDESTAAYAATSQESMINFKNQEKLAMYQALFDTLPDFRSKLRIFSPRSSLLGLIRQYQGDEQASYACRGGIDFFFIDSKDCKTYPCGYRGNDSLGAFEKLEISKIKNKPFCRECDWECFRDPSELGGPLLDLFKNPGRLIKKMFNDKKFISTWLEDLRYYKACDYFDGRKAINKEKLKKYLTKN